MPLIRKVDNTVGKSGSKVNYSNSSRGRRRAIHRSDTPLQQLPLKSPNSVHVYKLNKRRESDAKCRANLCLSFEQLRQQVFSPTYTHRVSREMILQETLSKVQYLEGILILLQQTKDQKENKNLQVSGPDRLSAIHTDFIKANITSSSYGNKKNLAGEQPQSDVDMEESMEGNTDADTKLSQQQQWGVHTDRLVPQQSKNKWIHHDQVVPLPKSKQKNEHIVAVDDMTMPHGKQDDLPHTIIVPYITKKYPGQHLSSQEVPSSSSAISLEKPKTKKTMVRIRPADSYHHHTPIKHERRRTPSPMQTSPDAVEHYKIKNGSIKSVTDAGDVSWKKELEDILAERAMQIDDNDALEPDLTCKEVIPYWLEEERSERRRMLTPLKHTNATYPYPMAPRKSRNTKWSSDFIKQSRQSPKSASRKVTCWSMPKRRRGGKRLFVDTGIGGGSRGQCSPAKRPLYIDELNNITDKPPRRQYRKLCTAARVRPYDHITGKVQSPVRASYQIDNQYRRTGRKAQRGANQDPEFTINSYYRHKIKKTDPVLSSGGGGGKTGVTTKTSPSQSSSSSSSRRLVSSRLNEPCDDIEEPLDILAQEADADWTKHFRDKNQYQTSESCNDADEEAYNSSQESLFLHHIPHLPEEIMYPLDMDDEEIVDTILQLEEDSISTSIDLNSQGISEEGISSSFSSVSSSGRNGGREMLDHYGASEYPEMNLWSPESQQVHLGAGCSLEQLEDLADCQIIDNISGGASLVLGNASKPADSSVVHYLSPIKQTPLVSHRSNPTLSSASAGFLYQAGDEELSASPLLTAAEFPNIIRMEDIKDVAEVHFTCNSYDDVPQSPGYKTTSLPPPTDNSDLWQLEQLDMIGFNPDIDQLVGDENIMVCSPSSAAPRQEVPQYSGTGSTTKHILDGSSLTASPSSSLRLDRLSSIQEWLPNIITSSPGSGPLQVVPSFDDEDDDQFTRFAF